VYLTQSIKRAAQIVGRQTATDDHGRRRTWIEFVDRVARLAAGLKEAGLAPGDRVAMLALNSDRYLEYFFGTVWAGAVFVPINTRLALPEFEYWLNDSGSRVLMVDDTFLSVARDLDGRMASVEHVIFVGDDPAPLGLRHYESLIDGMAPAADALRGGDDLAGLFYTGGTTGVSKGVMLSHRNLVSNALNVVPGIGFNEATRWLHSAPMFHLADGTATFGVSLGAGSHYFIAGFDPVAACQAIERHRITNSLFVPTMVNMLVNHPRLAEFDLSSLERVLYGASPMPEAVIEKAMEVLPRVEFIHAYGQTECAPAVTIMPPEYHVLDGPLAGRIKSCGRAVLSVEVRVVDDTGAEVPAGTVGEICARGPNVMLGYWNKPELTAATIRDGWIHTGDGGYMDEDGFVYVVDRVKDMIISGGENVYSAEVENAIYELAAVIECAVIGVPDERWGERVHAIVRLSDAAALTEAALFDHCRQRIAGYKCPRSVEFQTEPLPLSGAGKILKSKLREPYWAGRDRQVG